MMALAAEVNESIRRRENQEKLKEISSMLQGVATLVKPGRVSNLLRDKAAWLFYLSKFAVCRA